MPSPSPSNASTNSTTSLVSEGKKSVNSGAAKFGEYYPLLTIFKFQLRLSLRLDNQRIIDFKSTTCLLPECRRAAARRGSSCGRLYGPPKNFGGLENFAAQVESGDHLRKLFRARGIRNVQDEVLGREPVQLQGLVFDGARGQAGLQQRRRVSVESKN